MATRRYAEGTTVSIESTRNEIERVLDQYGATSSRVTRAPDYVLIEFIARQRAIRFRLVMPKPGDPQFTKTPKQITQRSSASAHKAWESECRRLWRALLNSIKAKLEAVNSNIATFDEEFMAYTIDPQTGKTVAETVIPALKIAYEKAPARLLLANDAK